MVLVNTCNHVILASSRIQIKMFILFESNNPLYYYNNENLYTEETIQNFFLYNMLKIKISDYKVAAFI